MRRQQNDPAGETAPMNVSLGVMDSMPRSGCFALIVMESCSVLPGWHTGCLPLLCGRLRLGAWRAHPRADKGLDASV